MLTELKKLGQVTEYVIAEEAHKDGNPHRHAFIKYEKRVLLTSPTKFDLFGQYGNY